MEILERIIFAHFIKILVMKAIIAVALFSLPFCLAHSEPVKTQQLTPQTSAALPAHLTTRIDWQQFPKPHYQNQDLNYQDRSAIVRVSADETGQVTQASIQESSGVEKIDEALLKAVASAQVKPHQVQDTTLPIIGYQVFNLKYQHDDQEICQYQFNSQVWQAQQQGQKAAFTYQQQPVLALTEDDLNQHTRRVAFELKVNKKGDVKQVKINKGSGIYNIDQQVKNAAQSVRLNVARKYWLYKPNTLKDEIVFKLNHCA